MSEKLKTYRKKRNFDKTAEPSGAAAESKGTDSSRLTFAVQYHLARREHYDLRLEWDGVLLSWAVPKGPSYNPKDKRLAIKVEDHPLEYANFEGTIPAGEYGGGTVMLWDEGTWEPQTDFAAGIEAGSLKIELFGARLKGKWALVRLKSDGEDGDNWLLIKEKDAYALRTSGITRFRTGIRSGLTADEIAGTAAQAKRNPFDRADVQLTKLVDAVPESDEWLYEIKYDGYRILAYCEEGKAHLASRNGHDYTDQFPSVTSALGAWSKGRAAVLDGEMIVPDENGKSDFQALQNYLKKQEGRTLVYMAFDFLALDGRDLRQLPLIDRKAKLAEFLRGAPRELAYGKHMRGDGVAFFDAASAMGLEGIVAKRADSRYLGDRGGDWVKVKCDRRQEFVVAGYTKSEKNTGGVSALLLGVYEDGKLIYAGRAGTGFTRKSAAELEEKFQKSAVEKSALANPPKQKHGERITWVKPRYVAEIRFAEWTKENVLRQASFKGLRTDKAPKDVVRERESKAETNTAKRGGARQSGAVGSAAKRAAGMKRRAVAAGGAAAVKSLSVTPGRNAARPQSNKTGTEAEKRAIAKKPDAAAGNRRSVQRDTEDPVVCGIAISSPDKIIYRNPKVSKLDVVRYYERVAERMLAYAGGRVLSVVRCHGGVSAACFFKKHPVGVGEGVAIIPVVNSEGESSDYFYLENETGLIAETQLGSLEYHIWGSRANALERPDMMVFDLDPDEGMDADRVRRGVRDLKSVLERLGLKSFLKTSGGKGYHVVVPFRPTATWSVFHDFARRVAELMERQWPDRYTSNVRKVKRKGKIFIDWARNGRGSTSVAPYSLRARRGAKVSCPIAWSELDNVAPDGIDLFEALRRIEKRDPWQNFFKTEQELRF